MEVLSGSSSTDNNSLHKINIFGWQIGYRFWFNQRVIEKANRLGCCWVTAASLVSCNTDTWQCWGPYNSKFYSSEHIRPAHHLQHVWHTLPVRFLDVGTTIDHPLVALKRKHETCVWDHSRNKNVCLSSTTQWVMGGLSVKCQKRLYDQGSKC